MISMTGVFLILSGCATIMHGTSQSVGFSSKPTGASVTVDSQPKGNTPLIVNLSRKDNHVVQINLEGYQPYEATITRGLSGWVIGNLVFGGLIGLAVDAISGGLYKLTPEQINAELLATGQTNHDPRNSIIIFAVLKPNPNWERIGELTLSE